MKKKSILLLGLIFLIGLFLRLYRLNLDSPTVYGDEAGIYVHYGLIHLKQPFGLAWLYNHIFLRTYTFSWIFGLNPLGIRIAPAIFGSISCLLIYYFATTISKRKDIGILVFLLTAIMPWNYMISRIGHVHQTIVIILITLHVTLFVKSKSLKSHIVSFIPLFLSLVYYPSALFVGPFIFLFFIKEFVLPYWKKYWMVVFSGIFLTILLAFGLTYRYKPFSNSSRGFDLAIWRDVNTPYEIDKYRSLSWNSASSLFSFYIPPEQLANKIVYNRLVANLSVFARNYLSFFSPDWLFLKGDAILRHSTGQVGEFYSFLLPFMLYGAYGFFQTADKKTKTIFLIWILASPLPAAITKDGAGYLLRAVTMLPFLTYFCALGLVDSVSLFKKKVRPIYIIILFLIGLYSAYYFFYGYFHVYPSLSERSYEYGFHQLADFQVQHRNENMLVVWDGYYPNMLFRFWQQTPFMDYQNWTLKAIDISGKTYWQPYHNLFFSNSTDPVSLSLFLKQYQPSYLVLPDQYFVKYSKDLADKLGAVKIEEIKYPDQTTAFQIYGLK